MLDDICSSFSSNGWRKHQPKQRDYPDPNQADSLTPQAIQPQVGITPTSEQSAISRAVQSIGHAGSAVGRRLTLHVALRESPADESYATPVVLTVSGRRFSPR
jgi:hypothetical protein